MFATCQQYVFYGKLKRSIYFDKTYRISWVERQFDKWYICKYQISRKFVPKGLINKAPALKKKIVRIICGVHPRTHTDPLYKALHVLNVEQIRDYSIALFMYKLRTCMLPSMFENMFISMSDVHDYYTRQANLLYVQYASTKRSQRTIKHFGTKLWNSLCNVIDIDCAIST